MVCTSMTMIVSTASSSSVPRHGLLSMSLYMLIVQTRSRLVAATSRLPCRCHSNCKPPRCIGQSIRHRRPNERKSGKCHSWWTFRIFFIFSARGGQRGAQGARSGGGRCFSEKPRRGAGFPGGGGAEGPGGWNWGIFEGGGRQNIYFGAFLRPHNRLWGPPLRPILITLQARGI